MYQYKAEIIRLIDGDTVEARLDLGLHTHRVEKLRLSGIDAPEKYQVGGSLATGWLQIQLSEENDLGSFRPVYIQTEKQDKYGRWLAWLYLDEISMRKSGYGDSLNVMMVNEGLARFYSGGKRKK